VRHPCATPFGAAKLLYQLALPPLRRFFDDLKAGKGSKARHSSINLGVQTEPLPNCQRAINAPAILPEFRCKAGGRFFPLLQV
jgi:hypothetical protein